MEVYNLPRIRKAELPAGAKVAKQWWRCGQPGDKTNGVAVGECFEFVSTTAPMQPRPTCPRHPHVGMVRIGNEYVIDGKRYRLVR